MDPTRTEVTIAALHQLPPFCVFCGGGATHYRPIRLARGKAGRAGAEPRREYMQLSIPACRTCDQSGQEPTLRDIDWESSTARAVVHVEFEARLRESGYV